MLRAITTIVFITVFVSVWAQEENKTELTYKGQLSSYGHLNPSNAQPFWLGGRYIPQGNLKFEMKNDRLLDFEASVNAYGNLAFAKDVATETSGALKPYRLWARYSGAQWEVRAGLQKINFGSANAIRPLMWFDQIDPRDPLKLTDGVWGILGRYYFLNNANVWLWALYGNNNTKGWEYINTVVKTPEFGGRLQLPYSLGEVAFSYHHRRVYNYYLYGGDNLYGYGSGYNPYGPYEASGEMYSNDKYIGNAENRYGFDVRLDWVVGLWFEVSHKIIDHNENYLTNQTMLNIGGDYTFGIGSGLYFSFEHLIMAYDQTPFEFSSPVGFTITTVSYPIGLFDNISAIIYYNWKNNNAYNFVNYQKQFNNISIHFIAYWNPENYQIPMQTNSTNLFGGKGGQIMLVWTH